MKKNNSLIAFILGILTMVLIVPVASSVAEWVCQWIESGKAIPIEKTTKRNINIARLQNELEKEQMPENSNVIGYEIPDDCEIYGDYCRNKIGFK